MRGETAAGGIKRRMAEASVARRKAARPYGRIAMWGGATSVLVMLTGWSLH